LADTLRARRRAEIVAAARRIVASEGLAALTIGALEQRLAFTRGVITYHFRNKDEIVAAVLDSAIAEIDAGTRAEASRESSAAEKVRAVLRATVRGFLDHREAVRILISFWGQIPADARLRRVNAELYATYRRRAARLVRAGRASGEFADVPIDATAALLVGVVIGVATQVYFEPGAIDPDAVVAEAQRTVLARLLGPQASVPKRVARAR
jgi:AcrR family transcriptional regulator